MPNYIDELEKLGLSKGKIAVKAGKSLKTIYTHQHDPNKISQLEALGYEKLIETIKAGA